MNDEWREEIRKNVEAQNVAEVERLTKTSWLSLVRYAAKYGATRQVVEAVDNKEAQIVWPTGDEAAEQLASLLAAFYGGGSVTNRERHVAAIFLKRLATSQAQET